VLPFSERLAREQRWTSFHALGAIEEYRRFAFLAMAAGHPVTPSIAVDEVWHLHLVYTRTYWEEWCEKVLGSPLHHEPTAGGAAESEKFGDWYARTLSSYHSIFKVPPPDAYWPDPARRFADCPVRVDARTHLVLPVGRSVAAVVRRLGVLREPGYFH
jgi:hypothetical protein